MKPLPLWIDGRLQAPGEPALEAEDSSIRAGQACYTSALVRDGEARWAARHIARLQRDAAALGLRVPDSLLVLRAFAELGRAAFGADPGIVRLQVSNGAGGAARLLGTARHLGSNPLHWRACTLSAAHPGPGPWPGVKRAGDPHLAAARAVRAVKDLDEVLLVDREGYVIEGSRSSLVFLDSEGELVTPDPVRGGVRSIARDILFETLPELRLRNVPIGALRSAREVVAVNAVRGARPIRELDGRALGTASSGGLAQRLTEVLDTPVG